MTNRLTIPQATTEQVSSNCHGCYNLVNKDNIVNFCLGDFDQHGNYLNYSGKELPDSCPRLGEEY